MKDSTTKKLIPVLLGLRLAFGAGAATYKWVDKEGRVHYSDKPVEGAERVDLPELPTYAAPVEPTAQRNGREPRRPDTGPAYTRFEFISPKSEQVFWDLVGKLPVQLALEPGLRDGDRINIYLDGKLTGNSPTTSLGMTLEEVWRGSHSLKAVVVGPDGAARITAESGTFHVKQHSQKLPNTVKRGK